MGILRVRLWVILIKILVYYLSWFMCRILPAD
jgi:hypothetical protein